MTFSSACRHLAEESSQSNRAGCIDRCYSRQLHQSWAARTLACRSFGQCSWRLAGKVQNPHAGVVVAGMCKISINHCCPDPHGPPAQRGAAVCNRLTWQDVIPLACSLLHATATSDGQCGLCAAGINDSGTGGMGDNRFATKAQHHGAQQLLISCCC